MKRAFLVKRGKARGFGPQHGATKCPAAPAQLDRHHLVVGILGQPRTGKAEQKSARRCPGVKALALRRFEWCTVRKNDDGKPAIQQGIDRAPPDIAEGQ